ncbi:DUF3721 domain-containing protein [Prochlorococcus sp. MIT 1307]|uniref:DUF3721 domain-containing protein n=1 Tax=Prochlorococcus sp. MIT 1307 TaxID=3096219 RepID=UPI0039BF73B9
MRKLPTLFPIGLALVQISLVGCSSQIQPNETPKEQVRTPALFKTKSEAEKAAKAFNCTGAHKMGSQWMPCQKHKHLGESHNH